MIGSGPDAAALLVQDCVDRLAIEPLLAHQGDDLLGVVRHAAAHPQTRIIGVLDHDGRLVGIVPILRLVEAVIARVSPAWLLADIAGVEDVARFGEDVEARAVGDVMLEPAAVALTTPIEAAFRLMRQRQISGIYVVDEAGRPTGYMDLLELAALEIDAIERRESGRAAAAHAPSRAE